MNTMRSATSCAKRTSWVTMIIVTHEVRFAHEVADRIVFMDNGAIVEEGPPAQLLDAPKREQTRRFLQMVAHAENTAA